MGAVCAVMRRSLYPLFVLTLAVGCKDKEVDASGDDEEAAKGESCAQAGDEERDGPACGQGLTCEPVGDANADGDPDYVCGAPVEIRGMVFDALDNSAIEGALIAALDETGAPVGNVAVSDADGAYVLPVSAVRDADGEVAEALKWTLFATAADYQPFPAGVRPAIPINAQDATEEPVDPDSDEEDPPVVKVIDNASTDVALIILPEDQRGGRTISGNVGDPPDDANGDDEDSPPEPGAGTLVVAEGVDPAPYTIADRSGAFTIFNVPDGAVTIVGYRRDLSVEPATPDGSGDQKDVRLAIAEDKSLPTVSGSVNIVNAPGGSQTSVVLVPVSVYNTALERGPVPFGLRAPEPPAAPSISGGFQIAGVPPGTYKVLAAFENDNLVRDPDMSIAGTTLQEITVAGGDVGVAESFKITEDISVVSPGAEVPELVEGTPRFVWADDSSEDYYTIVVFDAFGELVWEDPMVPRVTGSANVEVDYGGPALTSGMYYQFRATSMRDKNGGPTAISRTEDLRGVFIAP